MNRVDEGAPWRRRLAAACAVSMVVVVVASAGLRHLADAASWAGALPALRAAHRAAATLVLVGAWLLLAIAWRARRRSDVFASAALVAVGLALAVVGVAAGASRAPLVVTVNQLGGFVMLALCVGLAVPGVAGLGRVAWAACALALMQMATGALASASGTRDCGIATGCTELAVLHRGTGVLLALGLIGLAAYAHWERRSAAGRWLAAAVAGLLVAGLGAAGMGPASSGIVLLHGVLAALTLACLGLLARRAP